MSTDASTKRLSGEKSMATTTSSPADIQTGDTSPITTVDAEALADWSPEAEKKLVRSIDIRLLPTLCVLFILNFIDRNNFATARLYGLEEDLNLSDVEYQTCISILLVGYVLMQVPSNLILNAVSRPGWYLCACCAAWGIISAATAAVHNATGAIVCRFFLGCVEASMFPGSIYFLSRWYTRKEMQVRVTILNGGNLVAQAFGGLIAAGILGNMEGALGLTAWRWLFIIEGAITIAFAALAALILPNYPSATMWLSDEERRIATARLAIDHGLAAKDDEGDVPALQGLLMAIKDPKVWLLGLTYMATIMGLCFSYFFPTITQALGYGSTTTLLLTAPPWIWALLFSLPNAWHADRTGERFFHYLVPAILCIIGYILSMTTTGTAPRYVGLFLMTTGYACGFVMLAWISNTITRPASKKAASIAIVNAMGNIGSIPGAYIWPSKFGPLYVPSFGAEIGILSVGCIGALTLRFYLRSLNKKMDREEGAAIAAAVEVEDDKPKGDGTTSGGAEVVKGFRYLY